LNLQPASITYKGLLQCSVIEPDREYKCSACNAQFEAKAHQRSSRCPYCDSPYIAPTQNPCTPSYAIPFRIDAKSAAKALKKKIGSLWFAPDDFKKFFRRYDALKPHYESAWIYTFRVRASYTGQRGIDYIVEEMIYTDRGPRRIARTQTRWYPVSGVVDLGFEDLYIYANTQSPMKLKSLHYEIEPVRFDERMLSGTESFEYDLDAKGGLELAKASAELAIQNAIRLDIGGDRQIISTITRDFYNIGFEMVLIPYYKGSVEYGGEIYDFFVNAQNGKVVGERPYSWIKIALAIFGSVLFVVILLLVLQYFGVIEISMPDELIY